MGQYRPGSNGPVVRSANMTLMTSPRQQSVNREEMGEYERIQRDLRPMYTSEYRTMTSQSASTPSTVRSVSREQVDRESANTNMAIKPSIMGLLTQKQKQAERDIKAERDIRERHQESLRAMLSNHLIEKR
jgi:hypothetical protein